MKQTEEYNVGVEKEKNNWGRCVTSGAVGKDGFKADGEK